VPAAMIAAPTRSSGHSWSAGVSALVAVVAAVIAVPPFGSGGRRAESQPYRGLLAVSTSAHYVPVRRVRRVVQIG